MPLDVFGASATLRFVNNRPGMHSQVSISIRHTTAFYSSINHYRTFYIKTKPKTFDEIGNKVVENMVVQKKPQ